MAIKNIAALLGLMISQPEKVGEGYIGYDAGRLWAH